MAGVHPPSIGNEPDEEESDLEALEVGNTPQYSEQAAVHGVEPRLFRGLLRFSLFAGLDGVGSIVGPTIIVGFVYACESRMGPCWCR